METDEPRSPVERDDLRSLIGGEMRERKLQRAHLEKALDNGPCNGGVFKFSNFFEFEVLDLVDAINEETSQINYDSPSLYLLVLLLMISDSISTTLHDILQKGVFVEHWGFSLFHNPHTYWVERKREKRKLGRK